MGLSVQATLQWSPGPGLVGPDWATTKDFWRPHHNTKTHPASKELPVTLEPQLPECLGFAIPVWACEEAEESHLGGCGPQRSWVSSGLRGRAWRGCEVGGEGRGGGEEGTRDQTPTTALAGQQECPAGARAVQKDNLLGSGGTGTSSFSTPQTQRWPVAC